jgi:hypothetical protein
MERVFQGMLPITTFSEGGSFYLQPKTSVSEVIHNHTRSNKLFFYCRFSVDLLVSLADISEIAS